MLEKFFENSEEEKEEELKIMREGREKVLASLEIVGKLTGSLDAKIMVKESRIIDNLQDLVSLLLNDLSILESDKEQILSFLTDVEKQTKIFLQNIENK